MMHGLISSEELTQGMAHIGMLWSGMMLLFFFIGGLIGLLKWVANEVEKHSGKETVGRGQLLNELLKTIEEEYGGVPSFEKRSSVKEATWQISYDEGLEWHVVEAFGNTDVIAFNTRHEAERFMENKENRNKIIKFYRG